MNFEPGPQGDSIFAEFHAFHLAMIDKIYKSMSLPEKLIDDGNYSSWNYGRTREMLNIQLGGQSLLDHDLDLE